MRLLAHPDSPCDAVTRFDAGAARREDGGLALTWELAAELARLRLPAPAAAARVDGLWRHTCFEAFVGAAGAASYLELNFSPSGEWAAYRFSAYRQGMTALTLDAPPAARWALAPAVLRLDVSLPLLAGTAGPLQVALCAVIEARSGTMSYWAPRHPPGAPDFHHAAGRALELAPVPPAD